MFRELSDVYTFKLLFLIFYISLYNYIRLAYNKKVIALHFVEIFILKFPCYKKR